MHKTHLMNTPDKKFPFADKLREIWQYVHSLQSKELLTYFGFVLLAASIWFILAVNDNRETTLQIPVELTNVPSEAVLLQDMPQYIETRVRDKGAVIMNYGVNGVGRLEINFNDHNNGKDVILVNNSSLLEYARKQLKATSTILAFTPDSIRLNYTCEEGKRVPVIIDGDIQPSFYSTFSDSILAKPDSVVVYGNAAALRKVDCAYTEEVSLHNLSDTTYYRARVIPAAGTRVKPDSVTVVIPVEEYTTKTLLVPITIGGVPRSYSIMTFPSHVKLTCLVPMSKYGEIVEEAFLVGNTFENIQRTPGSYGSIYVANAPDYVQNVMLELDSVEYIINDNSVRVQPQTTDTVAQ